MDIYSIGELSVTGEEAFVRIRRRLYDLCCELGYNTIAATQIAAGFSEIYHNLIMKSFPIILRVEYQRGGLWLIVETVASVGNQNFASYFTTREFNRKGDDGYYHVLYKKNVYSDPGRPLLESASETFLCPSREELFEELKSKNREITKMHEKAEELVRIRTRQLDLTQEITIESLATLAESRDPETGGHIKRTQEYVLSLVRALMNRGRDRANINEEYIDFLAKSAPLHDIGKVGIPDAILLKPGKLNNEEYEMMKSHTLIGALTLREAHQKLGEYSFLEVAEELIVSHHEKWNGTGYPNGLAGGDIPLAGRIMALADVYDALVCKRVYKPPFTHTETKAILLKDSGIHFDPLIVDVFLEVEEEFREIGMRLADNEEEAEALKN